VNKVQTGSGDPSTHHDPNEYNRNRQDQKEVDEPTRDVECRETEQPHDEEQNCEAPQ
jgi:hypothetical protein